jgi:hypothetical protein
MQMQMLHRLASLVYQGQVLMHLAQFRLLLVLIVYPVNLQLRWHLEVVSLAVMEPFRLHRVHQLVINVSQDGTPVLEVLFVFH